MILLFSSSFLLYFARPILATNHSTHLHPVFLFCSVWLVFCTIYIQLYSDTSPLNWRKDQDLGFNFYLRLLTVGRWERRVRLTGTCWCVLGCECCLLLAATFALSIYSFYSFQLVPKVFSLTCLFLYTITILSSLSLSLCLFLRLFILHCYLLLFSVHTLWRLSVH